MANFVAAGISFADITTGFGGGSLAANRYWTPSALGQAPLVHEPIYDDRYVVFPNVDGRGVLRFGFRGRIITGTILYAGTPGNVNSQRDSDLATLKALARYTVSCPNGSSLDGCRLHATSPMWGPDIDGLTTCIIPFVFCQESTSN